MKLVVADAPSLKYAIESIVNLVEEGQFEVDSEGLHLKAMDPSQISMVSFTMPRDAFLEYEPGEEKRISLDIKQLSNVLSRGKKNEKAELRAEDGRLIIQFIGPKRKRTFKVPLLQLNDRVQKEPRIDFSSYAEMKADVIKEVLKDAKLLSSHVSLLINSEQFVVDVRGDSGDVRAEFEKGSEEVPNITTESGAKATFPLQYLEDMVKATNSSSMVKINVETDKPMKLEYEVEGARVVYYLAPRIETD